MMQIILDQKRMISYGTSYGKFIVTFRLLGLMKFLIV